LQIIPFCGWTEMDMMLSWIHWNLPYFEMAYGSMGQASNWAEFMVVDTLGGDTLIYIYRNGQHWRFDFH